jgi:hypothetical protein
MNSPAESEMYRNQYNRGYEAFKKGLKRVDNPWKDESKKLGIAGCAGWYRGYDDARMNAATYDMEEIHG